VAIKLALSAKHCLPGCVMLSSWTEAIPGKVGLSAQCLGTLIKDRSESQPHVDQVHFLGLR
jgi:hypothetical protein